MRLQTEQDEEPEINLTSLIDVVFLLLIFFMVSATFERQALLRVQLPEAATAERETLPERVELVITETGDYFVGDNMLADQRRDTLRLALSQAFADRPEALLVIRADSMAQHGLVVRAMDAASAEGITRLTIATVEEDGADP
ncbi:MAG TPA: biopolymer transporter ExbD [Wenzhouxiangellaceae bacterium]|nr:biopolymer transporter ExbD [Xanthomonadales bacterium]HKL50302.1 biopolymer transporter ExbD [Wenzhouxiangellaceae bacterium]|tara:strand:+ start:224 stop:649 length:426 start_codon:yes stop_codon:yes gene_type:complete